MLRFALWKRWPILKTLDLILETKTQKKLSFEVKRVILGRHTGCDRAAVSRNPEEARIQVTPSPAKRPSFCAVTTQTITTNSRIEVLGQETYGGAEFVLLCSGEAIYLGVGSDHTDRGLEEISVAKAKQLCPKPISKKVWPLESVRGRWDQLVLRSWVWREGSKSLYQEATLDLLMTPEDLIDRVRTLLGVGLSGTAIYSGTVAPLAGRLAFSEFFEAQLVDQAMKRALKCAYFVEPITWLDS